MPISPRGNAVGAVALAILLIGASTPANADGQPPACLGAMATMIGTSGNDVLEGTAGADVIIGLAGNDRIVGAASNSTARCSRCSRTGEMWI